MSDVKVVIFTENNARVIKNPRQAWLFADWPNAVINPDLSLVSNIPPHFWKLDQGAVVPMNEEEKKMRIKSIKKGVNNKLAKLNSVDFAYRKKTIQYFLVLFCTCALGFTLGYLVFKHLA